MRFLRSARKGLDGGSLRLRLLGLLLLPLLGLTTAAWLQIQPRIASERAATRAQHAVRAVVVVDKARSAVQQEVLPALALSNGIYLAQLGIVASQPKKPTAELAELARLRARSDDAIRQFHDTVSADAGIADLAAQVGQLRRSLDVAFANPGPPFAVGMALLGKLSAAENSRITQALTAGLAIEGNQALIDVDLMAHASQAASMQMPYFVAVQLPQPGQDMDATRLAWVRAWATYDNASSALVNRGASKIRDEWLKVNAEPSIAELNRTFLSQVGHQTAVSVPVLSGYLTQDFMRNEAYRGVLGTAVNNALDAAAHQRMTARSDLRLIVLGCLALLLVSGGVVFWVRKSLSSPLQALADQAVKISKGELTEVSVRGPREVRMVARALAGSVASLRNIEAQATAVAAGDLDSPVVRQPLPGPLGAVVHSSVMRIVTAIHEREKAQRDLAHQAAHDALTELPNREQALINTRQALHRAQRSSTMTALMFVDLDYFKAVNDTLGHAAGDEVLQTVAKRMQAAVRDGDTVARLGGDEFIILLEDVSDEGPIVKLAERIVEDICEPITIDQRTVRVGASVGVAFCRDGYVNADRLLSEADAAAYRAKDAGRGRVDVFDDDLRAALALRAQLETAISDALIRAEFVLHYQPVIDLKSGRPCGVEALIRWNRPGYGLLAPDDFIPMAEGSTLINDIGRWALHEATAQLARWQKDDPATEALGVAVNISGRHMASSQLVNDVSDALAASGIDAGRLTIELTETVLVDDPVATRNMQTLRALGVLIAIDDFGTGYTSIGQLPKLPVDTLKIDRSFIASPDPAHRELVRLIVAAAHAFDLSVVAEGVEYAYQLDEMRDVQVDTAQGFFFARPLPTGDMLNSALSTVIGSDAIQALPTVA